MKRILHIVSSLSKNAGVTSVIMNFYRELDKEKYQFDFVYFKQSTDDEANKDEIKNLGGRFFLIPKLNLRNNKAVNDAIENIFKNYEYSVVHCHEPILVNFIQKRMRSCGMKKLIIHSHSAQLSDTLHGVIRNRLMSIGINRYADYIVACSQKAGAVMFGKNNFSRRGIVITNGIDVSKYVFDTELRNNIRRKYNIPDDYLVIGTVGRCSSIKNHDYIFDLMENEELRDSKTIFILVGDGPMINHLKKRAKIQGLERQIVFAGSQDDVIPYLCAMDVFLFPSKSEGYGLALVEAELCNLFCIASDNVPIETKLSDYTYYIKTNKKNISQWINLIQSQRGISIIERINRSSKRELVCTHNCEGKLLKLYEL